MRDRHLIDAVELDGRLEQERRHEVHAQDANTRSGDGKASAGGKSMGGGSGPIGGGGPICIFAVKVSQPANWSGCRPGSRSPGPCCNARAQCEVEAVRGRIGRDVEVVAIVRNRKGRNAGLGIRHRRQCAGIEIEGASIEIAARMHSAGRRLDPSVPAYAKDVEFAGV